MRKAFATNNWPRLSEVVRIYVGEVFDNAPNKKYLSDDPIGPLVMRGANIDRYFLRKNSSQGKNRYLKKDLFLREKQKARKLEHIKSERIGLQRGAAVDNWRRLIACRIPAGLYSFDTVLLLLPFRIDINVLLGLLNSDLWEWRFRCTSTTNHVNQYELADLVVPPTLLDNNSDDSTVLRRCVDILNQTDPALARRSDSQTVSSDSPDLEIDRTIYALYHLDNREITIIRNALPATNPFGGKKREKKKRK